MNPDLSKMVALISDQARSKMLLCLMDGGAHPASELAYHAKIKPQTASFHLAKLLEANVIGAEKHGRHRYFKLINPLIAESLEQLLHLTPETKGNSFKEVREKRVIHYARTCYDHLAGYIGVQVTNGMIQQGYLEKNDLDFTVTKAGETFFSRNLEINLLELQKKRRAYARCCLDWTERKHHLAGALGHALLEKLFEFHWIERIPNTRAIKVTPTGTEGLQKTFHIKINPEKVIK